MLEQLPGRDCVLLGLGHTNAHVLRMWRAEPIYDTRLTCISDFALTTYSGMLPGVLAGQYPRERMQIDLVQLCAQAGAILITDRVVGLDAPGRRVLFADRPAIPFDVLSLGIGSVPNLGGIEVDDSAVVIKPMQTFLDRFQAALVAADEARKERARPLRVVVVGGGAGGFEIACCLPAYLKRNLPGVAYHVSIVDSHETLLDGMEEKTRKIADRELRGRGDAVHLGKRVRSVRRGAVTLEDGTQVEADVAILATGAAAPPLLEAFDLPKDQRGFLLTDKTLRTTSGDPIFVVGDSGTMSEDSTPKAGVYAVREGPVLMENLRRQLNGQPLQEYQPQRRFLKIFNLGNGQALAEYRGFAFRGRWCWQWKDWIDRRFMDKFQTRMMQTPRPASQRSREEQMRCTGCGGKVAGSVLSRVLARLDLPASEHVRLGLDQPDDATIYVPPGGRPVTATIDFFAAPLADPHVVGRLAALNAVSDVYAMGAKPIAALALVTIPPGPAEKQEELLFQVLDGGADELRSMGAALAGGHTIEGPQLTVGFTIFADQGDVPPMTKSGLRVGDKLMLTKPLGTGVLLRAVAMGVCRAAWYQPLVRSMLMSNQVAADAAIAAGATSMTDVTGFGLAGHLLEMLRASRVSAEVVLDALPLYAGASELLAGQLEQVGKLESTLAEGNRAVLRQMTFSPDLLNDSRFQVLFDPQTGGGLLIGVAADRADALLSHLRDIALPAAIIGDIVPGDGRLCVS